MPFPDLRLCLLFTPELCRGDPWQTLHGGLQGGVDLVQWRCEREDPERLRRCLHACRAAGVPVIVNDHVMLAVRSGADGAHVGQSDMPAGAARRILGERWLGVSTHAAEQIAAAAADGADYAGFGPCFPTATKGYEQGQTPEAVATAVQAAGERALPLFGIGGITADNLPSLLRLGVRRIAVSSAVLAAADPEAAARALRRGLDRGHGIAPSGTIP